MKVLCIDGGGIRGVFALEILHVLEEELKEPIGNYFDVLAGTSTGAIIAASIALNKRIGDILQDYKKYGRKIFQRQAKIGLFKSVYSDRYLRRFFKRAFGEITLAEIQKPLLIPAVDVSNGKPFVHRSNYGYPNTADLTIKLWDAVLSSCSAPVYFPPNNINNKFLSIDGGLWANNPSMVCITEILHYFNKPISEMKIMSIGTGIQSIDFSLEMERDWGIKQWFPFQFPSLKVTPKLLDLALHLSSESVSYHCHHLLKENYLRLNGTLGKEIPFDDVTYIDELCSLGREVIVDKLNDVKNFIFMP